MDLQHCADVLMLGELMLSSPIHDDGADFAGIVKRDVGELGVGAQRYCSDARIEHLLELKLVPEIAWAQNSVIQSRLHQAFLLQSSISLVERSLSKMTTVFYFTSQ